eukprot:Hpha_TRINITY_DN15862_c1_g8::TRINITY_DN15862_c1_g8_i1::g.191790::m.191790
MRLEDVSWLFDLTSPNRIQSAFIDIILAIREFRTYLPADIIEEARDRKQQEKVVNVSVSKIEAPSGKVTLAFTDIKSSTKLWETDPHIMDIALELHNHIIRTAITDHNGYEVKTIGDAFMSAFASAVDACLCMVQIQEDLLAANWPEDGLLTENMDSCRVEDKDGRLVHNGLRVRMGMHTGLVKTEINPLTERYDYKGPPVNLAARIEGVAEPGMVAITSAVLQDIQSHLDEIGRGVVVNPHGAHKLKGVSGTVQVYYIVSEGLKQRIPYFSDPKLLVKDRVLPLTSSINDRTSSIGEKSRPFSIGVRSKMSIHRANNPLNLRGGLGGSFASSVNSCESEDFTMAAQSGDGRFGRQMKAVTAGCAVVTLPSSTDGLDASSSLDLCNASVEACLMSGGITKGKLFSVSGENLILLWNVISECPAYKINSVAFLISFPRVFGRLQSKRTGGMGPVSRVGVSSGSLRFGRIGTGRTRFTIANGIPLTLATSCAVACRFFSVPGLYAHVGALEPNLEPYMRPVDVWRVPAGGAVAEIEMVDERGHEIDSIWSVMAMEATGAETAEDSKNAIWRRRFRAALNGDRGAFSDMPQPDIADPSSRTLGTVIELMQEHAAQNPGGEHKKTYRVNAPFFEPGLRRLLAGPGEFTGGGGSQFSPESPEPVVDRVSPAFFTDNFVTGGSPVPEVLPPAAPTTAFESQDSLRV